MKDLPVSFEPVVTPDDLTAASVEYVQAVWLAFTQDAEAIIEAGGADVSERLSQLAYKEVATAFSIGYMSCLGRDHPVTRHFLGTPRPGGKA